MANNTEIYIFNGIKHPRGGLDTINFDDEKAQADYYINHPSKIYHTTESKPIHEDSTLTLRGLFTTFEESNYLMYKFNGKWYYGFINSVHQDNYDDITNTGNITFEYELDYFQTYLFKIKALKHAFTVRCHLPNDMKSVSRRNYDELSPIVKPIAKNTPIGWLSEDIKGVLKWIIFVTKRKQGNYGGVTIGATRTGDINPFSMIALPVIVQANGIHPKIPKFVVNGEPSNELGSLGGVMNILMGNSETPNANTSQIVNIYTISEVPFNWTFDTATNTVNITSENTMLVRLGKSLVDHIEIIGIDDKYRYKTQPMEDPIATMWELLKAQGVTEHQMLNSTMCGVSLVNEYGIMDLDYKYLFNLIKFELVVASNVTDKGDIITTIKDYMGTKLSAMQAGIRGAGKSQTILSNASATYLQANKNAFENQKQQLDLRAEQLQATQDLERGNLEKVQSFGNRQNDINYGATGDLAFNTSQIGLGLSAAQSVAQNTGNMFSSALRGNVGGVLAGGVGLAGATNNAIGTGAQIANNYAQRGLNEDKDNYTLEYQRQSVNLSQRQAQQNLNMARKSFESANADRVLQPITINQMGLSTSMDYLNDLYTNNLVYWTGDKYSLTTANNELKRDGTFVADYYDLSDLMKVRKKFNKIQLADTIEISLNQARREMINGALNTGVRFWNYSGFASREEFEKAYMNNYDPD